jgi:hypothetical protein
MELSMNDGVNHKYKIAQFIALVICLLIYLVVLFILKQKYININILSFLTIFGPCIYPIRVIVYNVFAKIKEEKKLEFDGLFFIMLFISIAFTVLVIVVFNNKGY